MEKLKVDKLTKEALDSVIKCFPDRNELLKVHFKSKENFYDKWDGNTWKSLNKLSLDDMGKALYIGYEFIKSSEELAIEKYKENDKLINSNKSTSISSTYALGANDMLKWIDNEFKLGLMLDLLKENN